MPLARPEPIILGMQQIFWALAQRRWVGVGAALLVEVAVLVGLSIAEPAEVVGLPAAVAAAIAGTVAVVYGPRDGIFVAVVGALAFAAAEGWGTGEALAIVVWPAIVGAAGLLARRVAEQRAMLRTMLAGQERERERLALELHDDTAQRLTAALLSLQSAQRAATPVEIEAANHAVKELVRETIRSVRAIAVGLRPKALDDFGLAAAIERLCEVFHEQTGVEVEVDGDLGRTRLAHDVELGIYRTVQEALANVAAHAEAHAVHITLLRTKDGAAAVVHDDGKGFDPAERRGLGLAGLRHRARLLGGRLAVTSAPGDGTTVSVQIPV